jgi:RNA polymerase sigma-70 factor (ECF subfamily)
MPKKDERSFEALAVPHLSTVYRVARRLTRDDHEAEDLVQEAYLRAYRAFPGFEEREFGIRPWLLRIVYNTFINRRAGGRRAPKTADPQALDRSIDDRPGGAHSAPPNLDYERIDQEVKHAIDGLAEEFRSVLLLWSTMELSYQEIATVLDVPIGTVMSRLHRARQQLIRALSDFARENRLGRTQEPP